MKNLGYALGSSAVSNGLDGNYLRAGIQSAAFISIDATRDKL